MLWQCNVNVLETKGGAVALSLHGSGILAGLAEVEKAGDVKVFDSVGEGR